eukprot:s5035_g3.t1
MAHSHDGESRSKHQAAKAARHDQVVQVDQVLARRGNRALIAGRYTTTRRRYGLQADTDRQLQPALIHFFLVQRMQEMAAAAPQLYGASGTRGPSSEDSGSYSKDQLEAEVKRQVQAALSGQRDLMEENYKLRLEVMDVWLRVLQGFRAWDKGVMDVWLRVLQGFRAWDKGVRGHQKAIQQDFQFQVESKEDTWANMESLMAIYEDLWDRIVSKGVSLRMGFKRLGTQTSLREGYQEAIHQDFLYQVESKEVGFGRLGTQTSLREGYQEAIHQDFLYQVESKEDGISEIAYQEAIQQDFQFQVESKEEAIQQDFQFQVESKEVSLRIFCSMRRASLAYRLNRSMRRASLADHGIP